MQLARNVSLVLFGLTALAFLNMANGCSMHGRPAGDRHTSAPFQGAKANTGTVSHAHVGGQNILTLSSDFVIPDTPAPHWQVVDSRGNAYLLQRLKIKGDKYNQSIAVPSYIPSIAKVQIWCAWAETLLGEASFASPVN